MEKVRSDIIKSMIEATKDLRIGQIRKQEYIIYDNIIKENEDKEKQSFWDTSKKYQASKFIEKSRKEKILGTTYKKIS